MTLNQFIKEKIKLDPNNNIDPTKFNKDPIFRGHFYQREETGAGFKKLGRVMANCIDRATSAISKIILYTCWMPIVYAIWLYYSERKDLEKTAREFTAFKTHK